MGRFYMGDIEGKFWFTVQSSNDAAFFGGKETESEDEYEIHYFFDKEDMESIDKGLETCKVEILANCGVSIKALDAYFDSIDGYNDEMVSVALAIKKDKVRPLLQWYARHILGEKIKECVESKGQCSFTADL